MAVRRSTNVRRNGQLDRAAPHGQPRLQAGHRAAVCRDRADDTVAARSHCFGKFEQPPLQIDQHRSRFVVRQRPTHERRLRLSPFPPHRDQTSLLGLQQSVGNVRSPQLAKIVEVKNEVLAKVKA